MALLSKTIANLINGVSQQPPAIRNPTQCEAQENYLSDATEGNCHRPHSTFVAKLDSLGVDHWDDYGSPFFHTIDRGTGAQFKVMIVDGDLKVFDAVTGAEKTVTFPNGKAYLASSNPSADFQCLTLGSKTFVLNRTVTVTSGSIASDYNYSWGSDALVFVKQGDYSTDYSVTVSIREETIAPPASVVYGPVQVTKTTDATLADDIKTTEIAEDLKTLLDAASTASLGGGLTTERSGSVLWLSGRDGVIGVNYEIEGIAVEDSKGNNNLRLIRSQIQKFADLPTVAPTYYQVQVVGDKASGYDDYYVRFFPDDPNATFANGSWQETWAAGTHHAPRKTEMPLALTDNGDGTFTCAEETWAPREAGDESSNPNPTFIGKTIDRMFTFGNRLGFIYGGEIAMSEVGQPNNFYRTSVVVFLDSDPIFVKELDGFDKWLFAVPLAEKVILFSEKGQAIIKGDGLLTPKTAQIDGATSYPVSGECPPFKIGDNIYFTASGGKHSAVYEYYVRGDTNAFQAAEVTSHVPKYLPSGIIKLVGDDQAKILIGIGSSDTSVSNWNTVYVYKYFWIGDQKVQSSWSRWVFPDNLYCLDGYVIDGKLHLISMDPNTGDVLHHAVDLDINKIDSGASRTRTHLDLRLDGETLVSSLLGTQRTFTLPFDVHDDLKESFRVYRKEDQEADPRVSWGLELEILDWPADNQLTINDPESDIVEKVWIGTAYTSLFTLSEIHLKEDQNGAQVPNEEGKLTLKKISFLYNQSLYFRVEVTPTGRDTRVYPQGPYVIGDETPMSEVGPRSSRRTVPVNSENTKVSISVINDSVVPHRLQSAEWVGQYSIHSSRA